MFRAPGSLNFKSNPPKRCEVYSAEEFRYPVTAFKEFKRITEIVEFHAESDLVGPAERMCEKCAFIDYCIENAATLPEPMWYTMISIVAITEDGQKKVHERSETYPGYSYDQTEEYYERAAKMSRPCSCRYIRDFFGFDCPKEGCGVRVWGDRIFEKCGIGRDEGGDGGKTLEIRGKRRLSARDGGANYQQS